MRPPLLWALVFAAVLLPAQAAVGMRAANSGSITGDEPFYMLTAQSLVSDGDLDLRDEYANADVEMARFWDGRKPLWKQMEPAPDGRLISPHDPGLALLITPAYAAGGLRGVQRFLVVLWAAAMATAALVATRMRERREDPAPAAVAAVAIGAGAPGIVYASQVYPEGPAALVVALLLLVAIGSRSRALLFSLLLVALVWLGIKYAPLGAVLALLWVWRHRDDRRGVLAAGLLAGAAAVHFVWWHFRTFGTLTPYSTNLVWAGRADLFILADHIDVTDRLYRLHGLFLDARFGLFRWSPITVLALWGIRRRTLPVVAVIGVCVLMGTFASITIMGWWFPGRMLVAGFPALVVLATAGVGRFPLIGRLLGAWSLGIGAAVAWGAHHRWIRTAVDPFEIGFPLAPHWLFPDFRDMALAEMAMTTVWFASLAGLLWITRWRSSCSSTGTRSPTGRSSRFLPTWPPPAGR